MARNTHRSNNTQSATTNDILIIAIILFMLLWTIGQNIENHYRHIREQEHLEQLAEQLPEGAILVNGQIITQEQQQEAAREYELRQQRHAQEENAND